MQTDATSHNIVGPNNVGCCWPTMLCPFALAFMLAWVIVFHEWITGTSKLRASKTSVSHRGGPFRLTVAYRSQ